MLAFNLSATVSVRQREISVKGLQLQRKLINGPIYLRTGVQGGKRPFDTARVMFSFVINGIPTASER